MGLMKRWLDELTEHGEFEDLAETEQPEPLTDGERAERQDRARAEWIAVHGDGDPLF